MFDNLIALAGLTLLIPFGLSLLGFMTLAFPRIYETAGRWLGILTVVASVVLLALSFGMLRLQEPSSTFSLNLVVVRVDFYIDALSIFFILLVNTIALAATWNSLHYLKEETISGNREQKSLGWQHPLLFHTLVNLFHFTMLLVPMVDNLVGVWIAIELTTLGSAFLVAYPRRPSSWEAAWKYLIITSTGIILALLGTIFLANAIPRDMLTTIEPARRDIVMNWTFLMEQGKQGMLNPSFVWFAFLFALVGYGTKAGLAPMHTWLPDGHGEAPSPISALLSGVLLKSALYVILRFYTLTNVVLQDSCYTSGALLFMGLFSLIVAVPLILKENPFKRVLAYHSLEHMGIIVFGLALGGPVAIFGAVLHMLNHAVTKSLMFLAFGNVLKQYEMRGIPQEKITGVLRSMPLTGGLLTLGGLALVGSPPFNIFMSEFIILWGGIGRFFPSAQSDLSALPPFPDVIVILAILIFLLSTSLIFYGLVKHLYRLVLGEAPDKRRFREIDVTAIAPLLLLFSFMVVLGVYVLHPLANLINQSVTIILHTEVGS